METAIMGYIGVGKELGMTHLTLPLAVPKCKMPHFRVVLLWVPKQMPRRNQDKQ